MGDELLWRNLITVVRLHTVRSWTGPIQTEMFNILTLRRVLVATTATRPFLGNLVDLLYREKHIQAGELRERMTDETD